MGATIDQASRFDYNDETYQISIRLVSKEDEVPLKRQQIELFEYVNQINSLFLTGTLIYKDDNGLVEKFTRSQDAVCVVTLNHVTRKKDGDIESFVVDKDEMFCHRFLIDEPQLLERKQEGDVQYLRYKLALESEFALRFDQHIDYSNYKTGGQEITAIWRNLMAQRSLIGFKASSASSRNMVKYCTNGRDTLSTAFEYLMDRMYLFSNREESIIFFVYDEVMNDFTFVDLSKPETFIQDIKNRPSNFIGIQLFRGSLESLQNQELPVGMAALTSMPLTEALKSMQSIRQTTYDFDSGEYKTFTLESNMLMRYFNAKPAYNQLPPLYKPDYRTTDAANYFNSSEWSKTDRTYFDLLNNFMFSNGMILSTHGNVNMRPGQLVEIAVTDRDLTQARNESVKEVETVAGAYKCIEGQYFATRVRHKVCGLSGSESFTMNVCLAKNYK